MILAVCIAAFTMIILGGNSNDALRFAGLGLLGGGIYLILIVSVIVASVLTYRNAKKELPQDEKSEPEDIETDNPFEVALYAFWGGLIGKRMKPAVYIVTGTLFIIALLSGLFLGTAFLFMHYTVAAVVCLCFFGLSVIISLTAAVIRFIIKISLARAKEMNDGEIDLDQEIKGRIARVINCESAPENQDSPDDEKFYIITLEINGETYKTLQRRYFEVGSEVVADTLEQVAIIDPDKTEELQKKKEIITE